MEAKRKSLLRVLRFLHIQAFIKDYSNYTTYYQQFVSPRPINRLRFLFRPRYFRQRYNALEIIKLLKFEACIGEDCWYDRV